MQQQTHRMEMLVSDLLLLASGNPKSQSTRQITGYGFVIAANLSGMPLLHDEKTHDTFAWVEDEHGLVATTVNCAALFQIW